MFWGFGLDSWNTWIVVFVALSGAFAIAGGLSTWVAYDIQKQEAKDASDALEQYKLTVDGKVADAQTAGIEAGKAAGGAILQAAEANERAAKLEKEAAGLRLELAKVRAPLVERRLTKEQIGILVSELTGSGLLVAVIAPTDEREINAYAKDFLSAFQAAKLSPSFLQGGVVRNLGINAVPEGVNVQGDNEATKALVMKALKGAKIPFGTASYSMPGKPLHVVGGVGLVIGARPNLRN